MHGVNLPPPPTPADARAELLTRSKRDHLPLRRGFVQLAARGGGPGPLAAFVSGRRESALDQYLLLHAAASGGKFDAREHAFGWARALGFGATVHGAARVSRNWTWLEQQGLVEKTRDKRLVRVTLLQDDGLGGQYTHPAKEGHYFRLSYAYWLDGWCDRLDLPAKAALLIVLSRKPGSNLPQDRAALWYGISPDTLGRGLRELRDSGAVLAEVETKVAPLSPTGYSWDYRYTVLPPLAVTGRRSRGSA
jgi:hypothetical protein